MKRIKLKNQLLVTTLFIVCVVFYLFLSVENPLLHNHHEDGEHHHDCPACEFLTVASLFDMPDIEPVFTFLCQVNYVISLDNQHFPQDPDGESFPSRAPPIAS